MPLTQVDQGLLSSTAQYTGFKNRIINGAMVIDQRYSGASVTITNVAAGTYTLDRWQVYGSVTSKFSVQQNAGSVTPPAGFTNYLGTTSLSSYSVGAGEYYYLAQAVEGFNVADFGWGTANAQTATVSFWVRSSLTGTFSGALTNNATNRSYPFSYTVSAANTWEQKSVTIPGDITGTWLTNNGIGAYLFFNLGSGSNVLGTAGAWTGSVRVGVTGSQSIIATNGATFYITGVQLEKGSTATSFDYRPYGTELSLCQRYFEVSYDSGNAVGAATASGRTAAFFNALNASSSNYGSLIPFKTTKRTVPSVTWYGVNGTVSQWTYCIGSSSGAYYGIQTNFATQIGFEASIAAPAPTGLLTAGQVYLISGQWAASAEL